MCSCRCPARRCDLESALRLATSHSIRARKPGDTFGDGVFRAQFARMNQHLQHSSGSKQGTRRNRSIPICCPIETAEGTQCSAQQAQRNAEYKTNTATANLRPERPCKGDEIARHGGANLSTVITHTAKQAGQANSVNKPDPTLLCSMRRCFGQIRQLGTLLLESCATRNHLQNTESAQKSSRNQTTNLRELA
jgi:hypothetical protein